MTRERFCKFVWRRAFVRAGWEGTMAAGSKSGGRTRRLRLGVSAFIRDEGGYTSVAVVIALLVSFSLVFAAASAEWVMSLRLPGITYEAPLSLRHERTLVVDRYRPGVVL